MKTAAIFAGLLAVAAAAPFSSADADSDIFSDVILESSATHHMVHTPSGHHTVVTKHSTVTRGHAHPTGTHRVTHRPVGTGLPHGTGRPHMPIVTGRPRIGTPKNQNSTSSTNGTSSSGTSKYKQFNGDGSASAGWPAMNDWVKDFETLWSINEKTISGSCANLAKQYDAKAVDNTAAEMTQLKDAVQSVAKGASIDPRFALAIMVQETGGCLRIYNTTDPSGTINNPSIFQDHNGAHSCNTGGLNTQTMKYTAGKVANPCPKNQIVGMVTDGVDGTKDGDGLKQVVQQGKTTYGGKDSQAYYIGARLYNSGSYDKKDLGAKGATRCYSSDIANRLIGFNGPKTGCTLDKQ